jgi:CHAT domain-containing protein/tetratricopeptide (TPR) repeat protein
VVAAMTAIALEGAACPPYCGARELLAMVARELAANRYAAAEQLAQLALAKAQSGGDDVLIAKLLNNLGAARIYRRNYVGAYEALEKARQLAARRGQREVEAGIWSNLASLYGMLAGWPAAEEALTRAAALMPADSRYRPALLAQRARLALQKSATDRRLAETAWVEAMQAASEAGDWQIQRHLWDDLFLLRLAAGDLAAAEAALANSYRLIALHRLRDPRHFWLLAARLRLAQRRPAEALACLRRASGGRQPQEAGFNALELAVVEVQAAFQLHGAPAALAACRRVWPEVMQWRGTILPETATETAADVFVAQLADQYVKAVFETGHRNPRAIEEAWAAVEQTRALGMLRMRARRRQALRMAEADGRQRASVLATASFHRTPTQPAGAPWNAAGETAPLTAARGLLAAVQAALRPQQTLFTFWIGDGRPTVWAITRRSIHCAPLPGRSTLVAALRRFREEVRKGEAPPRTGHELYQWMFGGLPAAVLENTEWLVSGDDELLLAPLGALAMRAQAPVYVGQARALTLLPSALWLLEPVQQPSPRSILAVGDLVHNGADPRWSGEAGEGRARTRLAVLTRTRTARRNAADLELPSLPGSRRELETICQLWSQAGREAAALRGFGATVEALRQSLQTEKTDIHFATHVLPAPGVEAYRNQISGESAGFVRLLFPVGEPFLALSLQRDGRREGLSAADLAALPAVRGRVVLNGCATGTGPAQPGAGIHSFASAWLAAGATSVVASLWQVDDDGALFDSYYRALLSGARPSMALHAAQTAMIRSRTWRAQPRYWAAYFHFGKD